MLCECMSVCVSVCVSASFSSLRLTLSAVIVFYSYTTSHFSSSQNVPNEIRQNTHINVFDMLINPESTIRVSYQLFTVSSQVAVAKITPPFPHSLLPI